MSQFVRRLAYLLEHYTQDYIWDKTFITTYHQGIALTVGYEPTDFERENLNNLYRGTTYANMKQAGFSAYNASFYSGYAPDTVRSRIKTVVDLATDLAKGSLDMQLARQDIELDEYKYADAMNDRIWSIQEGMRRSKEKLDAMVERYQARVSR